MDAKLNSSQQAVVDSDASHLLCLAGAGSGKTFTLIQRICRLVDEGVDPSSILVLTFTNAAAAEMKERYGRYSKSKLSPRFGTFHAFCYRLLADSKAVREAVGYSKVPTIAEPESMDAIFRSTILKCGTTLSRRMLEKDIKEIYPKDRWQYEVFHKAYKEAVREANIITFDILCKSVCDLFINNAECIQRFKDQYKYVMVDEMQDTDPLQWAFVSSFIHANILVVGDAKQSIYAFRNADSSIIKGLAASDDWTTIKLYENYRSTDEICQYANTIHAMWKDQPYNLDIRSNKTCDEPSVIFDRPFEADDISEADVININTSRIGYKTCAILARTNAEVAAIAAAFKQAGIDHQTKYAQAPVASILKSVRDNDYAIDWLSSSLPANQYNRYLRDCIIDEGNRSISVLINTYGYVKTIRVYSKYILSIREVLERDDLTLQDKYLYIERNLKLAHMDLPEEISVEEAMLNWLIERVTHTLDESKLYIGTIHSVKGLEYDVVHVIGVDGPHFTITSEEDRNLFYVACTRARERLYIHSYLVKA